MKLTIFRSSKGDALLISHPDGNGKNSHILVDGGMKTSFKESVAPYLNKEIKKKDEEIDLLCVSHIDDDHIVGVLALMDLVAEWRVFKHHNSTNSNANVVKPKIAEAPEIKAIWHNSFAETYGLGDTLPLVAQALHSVEQMTADLTNNTLFDKVNHKATSIRKGIFLSQRIQPEQLNIDLNPQYNGGLVKCNQSSVHKNEHQIGEINLSVIGPFFSDLTDLKEDWIEWEKAHRQELQDFYADLSLTALNQPLSMTQLSQMLLKSGTVSDLGDRAEVSIPNLASIMFLVEADGKTILMTGDGHSDDILKGLKKNKKLSSKGTLHVNVLKIQHHGAAANIDAAFCKKITADHYVFCGNGSHSNPEETVIDVICNSRRGTTAQKSKNNETDQAFKFWFSANPNDSLSDGQKEHLTTVSNKLIAYKEQHQGFDFSFMSLNRHSQTIVL